MSVDEFNKILSRQTPDEEKRRRADFIIETGLGMEYAQAQVDSVINLLRNGSLPQTFSAKTD
jgi:dephospho-CoA kinase